MNRIHDRQSDSGGPTIASCLIIVVAIGLIFLPTMCGLSMRFDLPAAFARPY